MPLDAQRARQSLKDFDFRSLFVEELGWERHPAAHPVTVDGNTYRLDTVAHKRGLAVFVCQPGTTGQIPDYPTRRKIDRQVAKIAHEHVVVFVDSGKTTQVWQWVKKEPGKPVACREHTFYKTQPGDALIQKLQALNVSIDEEATLTLPEIAGRVRAAFDVERVTKRFYDRFKSEHEAFLKFLKGIPDEDMQRWYVSVMLNRLMFIYFIQKKEFLGNNDSNYLRNKLTETKKRGKDLFYREFLCPLFFEGFAKKAADRSAATNTLLGKVPYLNGGLFLRHQIEELYGNGIQIADAAFEKLFAFFEQYHWHLDERPLKRDDEINPDVLGYIFEKYINQKQMGAYYSKEDITGYIGQNAVIPFLFDQARKGCQIAFEGPNPIWRLLQADPDRYIYDAVKKGSHLKLPSEIATGLNDTSKRTEWNRPATDEYALPTEIWREVVARRKRYEDVRKKLASGQVSSINDLITYNLDIRQFAQDVIETSEGPELVRAFYKAIKGVSVLDPACGSGAFLFAALNILESLYEACLDRMQVFLDELEQSKEKHRPEKFSDFRKELELVVAHPNRKYFIYKTIIVNNLFGVDIMEEATEICKLRLFLKLVAQIDRAVQIEPLPDIDFNIRTGNTLVGYVSYDAVKRAVNSKLDYEKSMERIEEKAQEIDRLFRLFHDMQSDQRMEAREFGEAKHELLRRLKTLEEELNRYLAGEYAVKLNDHAAYEKWLSSHKPFHWFIEFYGIMNAGGFAVTIGNPPYVEYSKIRQQYRVRDFATETCGNLYALMAERSFQLQSDDGSFGFIVPVSFGCTQRMLPIQNLIASNAESIWLSNYAERPSKLFVGAEVLLTIILARKGLSTSKRLYSTPLFKWSASERPFLFERLAYCPVKEKLKPFVIPKLGRPLERSILAKMTTGGGQLGHCFRRESDYQIYYRIGGGRYWKIFTNFQPYFSLNGKKIASSRENHLYFDSERIRDAVLSILSSSCFYWYFMISTNGRDLNRIDLEEYPLSLNTLSARHQDILMALCASLMEDYRNKGQRKDKTSSLTGRIVYQEFYPRLSKPILDQIDSALAQHYGLDAEELDFILNYDIKHRMGDELDEADD